MATYTTIDEMAASMANRLGLDSDEVREALRARRQEFGAFEDVDETEDDRLSRLVWADVTDGAAWPFGGETVMANGETMEAPAGALAWKYADPTEDARWVYDEAELAEIRAADPSLLVMIGDDARDAD